MGAALLEIEVSGRWMPANRVQFRCWRGRRRFNGKVIHRETTTRETRS